MWPQNNITTAPWRPWGTCKEVSDQTPPKNVNPPAVVGGWGEGTCSWGRICQAERNDPKVPWGGGRGAGWKVPGADPGGEPGAGRGGRARRAGRAPHLHAGVVLEEEEHHALIDAVEPVVHRLVAAGGQEGGQQPPGPPGQHVGGGSAQEHGGRQHAAHRVHVEHQGQQHLAGAARGMLRRLLPARDASRPPRCPQPAANHRAGPGRAAAPSPLRAASRT